MSLATECPKCGGITFTESGISVCPICNGNGVGYADKMPPPIPQPETTPANSTVLACPHCSKGMMISAGMIGQTACCPFCQQQFQVPPPVTPVPPPLPIANPIPSGHAANRAFCRNCGNSIHPQSVACLSCGLPPTAGNRFCPSCRAETHPQAVVCVKCGIGLNSGGNTWSIGGGGKRIPPKNPSMDPTLAAVLSVLLVGLGQILLGQTIKGVVMLIVALVLGALTGCLACLITFPVSAIDAYLIAKKMQQGKSVGEWEFF